MKKFLLISGLATVSFSFAQKPIVTRWKTSSDQDKQIAINNSGTATYTYEKLGDSSQKGSGELNDYQKTRINLPSSGEYIVRITPIENFALKMGYTQEAEASELMEVSQWGDYNWSSSISSMFVNCVNLQISATDVPNFSNVTDMSTMFYKCSSLKNIPNINKWDTSSVKDMSRMFSYSTLFNDDISNWNTSKVRNMSLMFAESSFNQNISNWDVSNVSNMEDMFRNNAAFNQDISAWNTGKVRSFNMMFSGAKAFNQNLSKWSLAATTDMSAMLDDSGISCLNYSRTLQGWAQNSSTPSGQTLTATNIMYGDAGKTYRDILVNSKSWKISGDVYDAACTANLGTNDVRMQEMKIVNPVKDLLQIQSQAKITSVEVYNMAGQKVMKFNGSAANVSSLPKGVYILKITSESKIITTKIIKE